jgi:hypothetical protein
MNIQSEAERRYPHEHESETVMNIWIDNARKDFIAGATWEQERSKGLVEKVENLIGLKLYERNMYAAYHDSEAGTTIEDLSRAWETAINELEQALNTYNNEQPK